MKCTSESFLFKVMSTASFLRQIFPRLGVSYQQSELIRKETVVSKMKRQFRKRKEKKRNSWVEREDKKRASNKFPFERGKLI